MSYSKMVILIREHGGMVKLMVKVFLWRRKLGIHLKAPETMVTVIMESRPEMTLTASKAIMMVSGYSISRTVEGRWSTIQEISIEVDGMTDCLMVRESMSGLMELDAMGILRMGKWMDSLSALIKTKSWLLKVIFRGTGPLKYSIILKKGSLLVRKYYEKSNIKVNI